MPFNTADKQSWTQFVQQLPTLTSQFRAAYGNLNSLQSDVTNYAPEMTDYYNSLVNDGATIQTQINNVADTYQAAVQWLQSLGVTVSNTASSIGSALYNDFQNGLQYLWNQVSGAVGLNGIQRPYRRGLMGLGQAQVLIPLAVCLALLAAMTYWLSRDQYLERYLEFRRQGMSNAEALAAAGPPPASVTSSAVTIAMLIAAALIIPALLKA